MDGNLIELVRKCEEFCDISNKKCSDTIWEGKQWGQISGEFKISGKFQNVSEVEMTVILQETKSTRSSEYSFGSPDEPGIKRNSVCDVNFLRPGRQDQRN
jgi:hypothetical protein